MRKVSYILFGLLFLFFVFEAVAAASDISRGIPGLKWGESVKSAKVYKLQHCGEPDAKGEPSFYNILSPEDFKLIGISTKTHKAMTLPPVLWTYNNRLMGVQLELRDTRNAISALKKNLGEPSRKRPTNTTFGIYEWNIKGTVRITGIDMRNGYMVTIYHLPTLKKLNDARRSMGKSAWN